ncbi:ComEC/Rec2 family competence protein [Archangium lansingense]|uniref:ComEC/Rec2 family competence protein n=1 Tax=Archangium lansingense TaxID=2995310 RepID=UPI003B820577
MASLDIYFLDVGQGDGTFIICPDGTTILVDLGSKKNGHIAGQDAIATIKNLMPKGKKIDYLFVTHGDGDHYNLIPELVRSHGFRFGKVYYSGPTSDYNKDMQGVIAGSSSAGFLDKSHSTEKKPLLTIGSASNQVDVFLLSANYPSEDDSDKNAKSICLMLAYGSLKAILMGDAEAETEDFIMNTFTKAFLKADVLKLAHHGSDSTNQESWLKVVQPRIVSASADQKWGHPYSSTIDRVLKGKRLADIYKHGIVAGTYDASTKDYDWETLSIKKAILTNLYEITGSMGSSWQAAGVAYVVQLRDDGSLSVGDTLNNLSRWF